jgi:2-oxoglutarate dehydrogenase E1 component
MMYQTIAKRPPIYNLYADKLIQEGTLTEQEVKDIWDQYFSRVSQAYKESLKAEFDPKNWRSPTYHSVVDYTKLGRLSRTGVDSSDLKEIGQKLTNIPEGFTLHHTIKKIYDQRRKAFETGTGLDFAMAESLAFGSLLNEGFNVRLSGQDVERGTFSQRHAVVVDQKTDEKYFPLTSLLSEEDKWRCQIGNSILSEYAVMGFEYGYALTNPNTLTIWEAQFGDFANGAQIVIDNYLTSGESKWNVQNSLVLNLPHGNDGAGPEHSSARVERFLQMMNDSWVDIYKNGELHFEEKALRHANMSVICCSTAHGIFHSLRRQMRRDFRKPLISFINKKLLKMKEASSTFADLNRESFDTILEEDTNVDPKTIKKLVLLTGQAYYSVLEKKHELERNVPFL